MRFSGLVLFAIGIRVKLNGAKLHQMPLKPFHPHYSSTRID